jgi:hypothetical protein
MKKKYTNSEKKKAYMRKYFHDRYHGDPEFREYTLERSYRWQKEHPELRREQKLRWSKRRSIKRLRERRNKNG